MKLLIDLQGAQASNKTRGIGRYSLALARAIAQEGGSHEIWIGLSNCFDESIIELRKSFDGLIPDDRIVAWNSPIPVAGIDTANHWRRKVGECLRESFIAKVKPDIVHVSSLFEGLGDNAVTSVDSLYHQAPTAVTLYDLIPLIHRHHYLKNPSYESWYECKLGELRRAQMWLAISESSRREGIDWLNLPSDRVINISAAADYRFRPLAIRAEDESKIRHKYTLLRSFVMYTGGIDLRKNIERLIEAYAKLNISIRNSHQLAIVCSAEQTQINALQRLASKCGLAADEVIFTGFVSDDDIVALYNLCSVFIFPSWHEGFGLPALEAMSCGAAVIAANTSSLPEVIGRPDALFDPHELNDMAAKLELVLSNRDFRDELKRHGISQAKKFSWHASARRAITGFEQLHSLQEEKRDTRISLPSIARPSLAYISPLPPEKSGIADYSAELLRELARHYKIDVVVDQKEISDPWIVANCTTRSAAWFDKNGHLYDRILYHFGNSSFHQHMFDLLYRHPGTVVLHDFYLSGVLSHMDFHGLTPGSWVASLYAAHGYGAVKERFSSSDLAQVVWKYPCSLDVIKRANGLIVHSLFSGAMADKWYGAGCSEDWVRIPHLRMPLVSKDRSAARTSLGLGNDDFLICSFGMLGETKLNHRLLMAWLSSPLKDDSRCHLVFVGQNHGGRYGAILLHAIDRHGAAERIKITGFASTDLYRTYLAAADAAVQLRTLSRGETSGTVLDCMNYGLPTIVNAHGSMGEISPDVVYLLPDQFSDSDLRVSLVALWSNPSLRQEMGERARLKIREVHHPWEIGNRYHAAIESFANAGPQSAKINLLNVLSSIEPFPLDESEWIPVARCVALNHTDKHRQKQLFVDISELVQRDAKSGIQRVVRNVLNELINNQPQGVRIEPVYASADGLYRYARRFTFGMLGAPASEMKDEPIETGSGDIFLGLDLCPQLVPECTDALNAMRASGTRIYFVIYDLLCVTHPEFFVEGAFDSFDRWLRQIAAHADGVIAISRATADEFRSWINKSHIKRKQDIKVGWFHLGANIDMDKSRVDFSEAFIRDLRLINGTQNILMVGTIEPRKGHAQTLEAFELLWERGLDANLVIVGKSGWKVESLLNRINSHPQLGKHLFWFESATDEMLEKLYENASGFLMASEAEGFGLPLIEAAQHHIPILARDIPVFREVAGEHAMYFADAAKEDFTSMLDIWIKLLDKNLAVPSSNMNWLTWAASSKALLDQVIVHTKIESKSSR